MAHTAPVKLGIVQTIELAASVMFAAPVFVFGVSRLFDGDLALGVGLVVVAALMVALPQYLTTPGDLPGKAANAIGLGSDGTDGVETDHPDDRKR